MSTPRNLSFQVIAMREIILAWNREQMIQKGLPEEEVTKEERRKLEEWLLDQMTTGNGE